MIEAGAAGFEFPLRRGSATTPMMVWTYRPASFPAGGTVLFVLHGFARNGRTYRDAWIARAEEHGALVLAPEFSKAGFPTPREFEVGNMRDGERRPLPQDHWTLTAVDRIFDAVREAVGIETTGYRIFGHSAGAQFVHRLLTFVPDCRAEIAVAANCGCYTWLDPSQRFPYGLGGMPLGDDAVASLLARRLTIMLGEEDSDADAPLLLKSPEAMRQGEHRLERGRNYYRHGEDLAHRLGLPFRWELVTLPGVGHSHQAVTGPAAKVLLG